jgi:sirohydrochlorin ferrochelatase
MRPHRPTETDKARVIMLTTNGCTQVRIAEHLAIDGKTLKKYYAHELNFGTEFLLAKVVGNLAQIAIKGHGMAAVSACKYLLSTRGNYRENAVLGVEPTAEGLSGLTKAFGVDSANVRERILARINEIRADPPEAEGAVAAYKTTNTVSKT